MAKKSQLKSSAKTIETLTHDEAKRKNIPTAEYQSVLQKEEEKPKTIKYPRNIDLDPQLVWRGKDEQDWSDLVVHAPPLYIQEKVHPKVLIDDLLRQTEKAKAQEPDFQTDLFADFNGIPKGVDKTEFYQHDQKWSLGAQNLLAAAGRCSCGSTMRLRIESGRWWRKCSARRALSRSFASPTTTRPFHPRRRTLRFG
jgi:hypothetical protein